MLMRFWKSTVLLVFCGFAWGNVGSDPYAIFTEANQAYSQGEYQKATGLYQTLITVHGAESAELRFNLGNTYFRDGQLGKAIFHYLSAQKLAPRDPDLKYNLTYAQEKTTDKIEPRSTFVGKLGQWLTPPMSEAEAYGLLLILTVLFWGFTTVALYKKGELVRYSQVTLGLLLVASLFWVIQKTVVQPKLGVVLKESKVYSGIGRDNVALFTLNEGTDFHLLDTHDPHWYQIALKDGKKGWLHADNAIAEGHEERTTTLPSKW